MSELSNVPGRNPQAMTDIELSSFKGQVTTDMIVATINHQVSNGYGIFGFLVANVVKRSESVDLERIVEACRSALGVIEATPGLSSEECKYRSSGYQIIIEKLTQKGTELPSSSPSLGSIGGRVVSSPAPRSTLSGVGAVLGLSDEDLRTRFRVSLEILEKLYGPSAVVPSSNMDPLYFGRSERQELITALGALGRPDIARALYMVAAMSADALQGKTINYSCIPDQSMHDCFHACWNYLLEVDRRQELLVSARNDGKIPTALQWLREFGQRGNRVAEILESERRAVSDPALIERRDSPNAPKIVLLDDENDRCVTLSLVPSSVGTLADNEELAGRELTAAVGVSGVPTGRLADVLTGLYSGDSTIIKKTAVHVYRGIVPPYPGQESVQFTIDLARDPERSLRVVPITGNGVHKPSNLLPANDPRIPNRGTETRVDVGCIDPSDPNKTIPFCASSIREVSPKREMDLLTTLGLKDSTSIVLIVVPMEESISLPVFEEPSRAYGMFGAERGLYSPMHTGMGIGHTSAKTVSGGHLEVDRNRVPTIIVIDTVAPNEFMAS